MTDPERSQVLKMIKEGKVTPEEGLKLIQALEQNPAEEEKKAPQEAAAEASGPDSQPKAEQSGMDTDPHIARVKSAVQRLWQIPLWIGVGVIILSAVGMYAILQKAGTNFWFFCLIAPLLLGVLVMAAAAGSRRARWLFVEVHQKPGEKPKRIFLGFPLPLKLTAWFLRTFGNKIDGLKDINVDEVVQIVETGFTGDQPLVVNVDEGEDGERVKVYIG
jgi:hypothetical protein